MKVMRSLLVGVALAAVSATLVAQRQNFYVGVPVTGQLALARTVNVLQVATGPLTTQTAVQPLTAQAVESHASYRATEQMRRRGHVFNRPSMAVHRTPILSTNAQGIPASPAAANTGFMGLTHYDQRNANGGNQFSIEPPSQGLAVGNGFVVEGVNNAFQVYNTSGQPLLPAVLSTNQVFGVSPAINRLTGFQGVYPTDIRVFYDQTLNRFFVLQRSQDNDASGIPLASSHLYMAVSQTGDPTGTYNVYVMDTTNTSRTGCPCISDYPEIGSDQYGIYLTWNEYNAGLEFVDAVMLAVSKASLGSDANTPTAYQFQIPFTTGYEFAIQPAFTPPGGAPFLAAGGLEYFVSSFKSGSVDTNLALWALTNTSSLGTPNPSLSLVEKTIPVEEYIDPGDASQLAGPTPLGGKNARIEILDGGDTRVQSVEYVGAQLYMTTETQLLDDNGRFVIGGTYIVLSPVFRGGFLSASVVSQGYFHINNNHLLRPSMAVNSQGQGAIVFTLVGPDYYPSAAFLTFNGTSVGTSIQIAGAGAFPEDGFTGYSNFGVSRWGDYSAAAVASDGSIWMATEYIPNAPRTTLANWGTYVIGYTPSN